MGGLQARVGPEMQVCLDLDSRFYTMDSYLHCTGFSHNEKSDNVQSLKKCKILKYRKTPTVSTGLILGRKALMA